MGDLWGDPMSHEIWRERDSVGVSGGAHITWLKCVKFSYKLSVCIYLTGQKFIHDVYMWAERLLFFHNLKKLVYVL